MQSRRFFSRSGSNPGGLTNFLQGKKLEHWSNGGVEQWGGMESREVDRNLRIVHCSTVQFSIAPGREAPLCGLLIYYSIFL